MAAFIFAAVRVGDSMNECSRTARRAASREMSESTTRPPKHVYPLDVLVALRGEVAELDGHRRRSLQVHGPVVPVRAALRGAVHAGAGVTGALRAGSRVGAPLHVLHVPLHARQPRHVRLRVKRQRGSPPRRGNEAGRACAASAVTAPAAAAHQPPQPVDRSPSDQPTDPEASHATSRTATSTAPADPTPPPPRRSTVARAP